MRQTRRTWILEAVVCVFCSAGAIHAADAPAPAVPPSSASTPSSAPQSSSPVWRDAKYYFQSTWSFRNALEAGFIAGVPNVTSAPLQPQPPTVLNKTTAITYANAMDQYSAQMDDWRRTNEDEFRYRGRRFGFGLATAETRDLLSNFLLPLALRQNPRYVPAGLDMGFGSRMSYAAESIFITRDDTGRRAPNLSKWIGTAGAALIAKNLYADRLGVPELDSSRFVWRYIGLSLAGDEATNLAHELVRTSVRQDLINFDRQGAVTEDNYYPLSSAGKLLYWTRSTYSPRNFIQGALIAGVPNIPSQPEYPAPPADDTRDGEIAYANEVMGYATAMEQWRRTIDENVRYSGRRFLGGFSESETQLFLGNCLFPLALRMDPRYIPAGSDQGIGSRMGSAFAQIAVSRTDSGRRMVNIPLLGSTVGAAFMAQQLYYSQLGVSGLATQRVAAKTIGFNLIGDVLLNTVREFVPRRGF